MGLLLLYRGAASGTVFISDSDGIGFAEVESIAAAITNSDTSGLTDSQGVAAAITNSDGLGIASEDNFLPFAAGDLITVEEFWSIVSAMIDSDSSKIYDIEGTIRHGQIQNLSRLQMRRYPRWTR
jgi:hypothetical protein